MSPTRSGAAAQFENLLESDAPSAHTFSARSAGPINRDSISNHANIADDTEVVPPNFVGCRFSTCHDLRMDSPVRRNPIHHDPHEVFNRPVIVFLTVCTKSKKPILANKKVHGLLREAWSTADSWLVGRYVLMPDHLHLFCSPTMGTSVTLTQWVSFWKSHTARHWPDPGDTPVWQRDFWDTQLRKEESYSNKWQYLLENPMRAGLVTNAMDWPYQGEIHELNW